MDTTQDTRLEELKTALATMPLKDDGKLIDIEKQFIWNNVDINALPALTTLDLSQFSNTPNTAPFANTSIQLGPGVTTSTGTTIYTIGGGGGGGNGSYGYVHPSTTTGTGAIWTNPPSTVKIEADDVVVKGRSLMSVLDRIEEQLGILDCDEILEQDWQELRELGDEYRKKKKHIEDKLKTFNTLKK